MHNNMSSGITWLEVGAWPGSRTSLESLQIPASDRGISSHTENVGEPDLGQRQIMTNFSGTAATFENFIAFQKGK